MAPWIARLAVLSAALVAGSALAHPDRYSRHSHYGYAPGYYYPGPYWYPYGPPLSRRFVSPYPVYGPPPPVVVERYDEPRPLPPPVREYVERSEAEIVPAPRRPEPARQAPRFERYTLSARELFAFDEASLKPPQPKLDEIADALKRNPQIRQVRITGYTDRLGTDAYNLKLSQRRADAVKAYLVRQGVAAERLVAVGKGKANAVVQCRDKDRAKLIRCLEPNRRVEVEEITVERRAR